MEDRKNAIRELEKNNRADEDDRRRLLEKLGEALFRRIGDRELFSEPSGVHTPGGLLAEYRKLQKEIEESEDIIKSLEADIHRLKELEEEISVKEGELSRIEKELEGVNARLGKALLESPGAGDLPLKQQEEALLEKIAEQEKKLDESEKQEGGFFSWLGNNAKSAVSKGLLLRHRSALQRLYRGAGEKYVSTEPRAHLEGEAAEAAEKAVRLKERLSSLSVNLSMLKGERRNIGDLFGDGTSPARRIQGQEKHIAHVKEEFPGVYFRLGSLAADGSEALSSLLIEEDRPVLEKAGILASQISERELGIRKLSAAIGIDDEKAEIERIKKAIEAQQQKINAAKEAIAGLEKQIAESEQRMEELDAFIQENGGL